MPPAPTAVAAAPSTLTMADVMRHNNSDDCWLVLDGNVYDATRFIEEHPGGSVLATWAGADATDVFHAFHPPEAGDMLSSLFVGPLEGGAKSGLLADFRTLKAELEAEGAFVPSYAYFAFKVASNLAILGAAVWSMTLLGGGYGAALVGATLLALFWQQCGWLSHDFLHHQVFEDRRYGDAMGLFLGNVLQGFAVTWWKNKHNKHHAIPNVMEGVREGDEDIDTMPLLAWADAFLEGDGEVPFAIRYQHIVFLPLLCVARISWCLQSALTVAFSPDLTPAARKWEAAGLLAHYAYYGAIAGLALNSWYARIVFFFASQAVAGLALGTVFVINHNSKEVLDSDAINANDFVTIQIRTTRNIAPSLLGDWFTGGLSYQIEHHLFPTLPRHRLGALAPRVKAMAEKHGLEYQAIGFWPGMSDVIACLRGVKDRAIARSAAAKNE